MLPASTGPVAVVSVTDTSAPRGGRGRDLVGIHRHRGVDRQSSTFEHAYAGIQCDALVRENIPLERGTCAKCR